MDWPDEDEPEEDPPNEDMPDESGSDDGASAECPPDEDGSRRDLPRKSGMEGSGAPGSIFPEITLGFPPRRPVHSPAPRGNHTLLSQPVPMPRAARELINNGQA